MDAIEQLENAIERANKPEYKCMTVSVLLVEIYRNGAIGFTDSQALVFAERLNSLCDAVKSQNEFMKV